MNFKPEDFRTDYGDLLASEAAEMANARIREWMESLPTAYSAIENNVLWMVSERPPDSYKHMAKLVPWGKIEDEPEF